MGACAARAGWGGGCVGVCWLARVSWSAVGARGGAGARPQVPIEAPRRQARPAAPSAETRPKQVTRARTPSPHCRPLPPRCTRPPPPLPQAHIGTLAGPAPPRALARTTTSSRCASTSSSCPRRTSPASASATPSAPTRSRPSGRASTLEGVSAGGRTARPAACAARSAADSCAGREVAWGGALQGRGQLGTARRGAARRFGFRAWRGRRRCACGAAGGAVRARQSVRSHTAGGGGGARARAPGLRSSTEWPRWACCAPAGRTRSGLAGGGPAGGGGGVRGRACARVRAGAVAAVPFVGYRGALFVG